jgi:hypothetical protein
VGGNVGLYYRDIAFDLRRRRFHYAFGISVLTAWCSPEFRELHAKAARLECMRHAESNAPHDHHGDARGRRGFVPMASGTEPIRGAAARWRPSIAGVAGTIFTLVVQPVVYGWFIKPKIRVDGPSRARPRTLTANDADFGN